MANEWGTICLPFAAEAGDGYDFYELSGVSGDALILTRVSTLEAGKPAVVCRDASATDIDVNAVSGTTFADAPIAGSSANGLTLTGAFTTTEITGEVGYIIANNAFWNIADIKGEDKVYCSPFHAYLAGTISGARCLRIGGEATGIEQSLYSSSSYSLEAHQASQSNGENGLNGLNGKFIVNGRLIIIRNGREYNAAGQRTE